MNIKPFNQNANLRVGGRKAPAGGREVLETLNAEDYDSMIEIFDSPKVSKDIAKINFDLENCEYVGLRTTESGVDYLLFVAGGDWEYPLCVIVYWDGKDLRGYVPIKGNTVNTLNKSALGNDEDMDEKYLRKIGVMSGDDTYDDFSEAYYNASDDNGTEFVTSGIDFNMCEEDFNSRIEVVDAPKVSRISKRRIKKTDDFDEEQPTKTWQDIPRIRIF